MRLYTYTLKEYFNLNTGIFEPAIYINLEIVGIESIRSAIDENMLTCTLCKKNAYIPVIIKYTEFIGEGDVRAYVNSVTISCLLCSYEKISPPGHSLEYSEIYRVEKYNHEELNYIITV